MTKFHFRRILDVSAYYADDPKFAPTVIYVTLGSINISFNGQGGCVRWVAAPGEGLIDSDGTMMPIVEQPCDGLSTNLIFDVEPDDSLLPPSWRDLTWVGFRESWWMDDDPLQWPFKFYRRRRKRAKLYSELLLMVNGHWLQVSVAPLDVRDACC
jgi:hypothetical protein